MCLDFLEGKCHKDARKCPFAHHPAEVRPPSTVVAAAADVAANATTRPGVEDRNNDRFERGPRKQQAEKRKHRGEGGIGGPGMPPYYKAQQPCPRMMNMGQCNMGKNCPFSHAHDDMR